MKALVMDAAGWWLTWAAFTGAAWGGLILAALAINRRFWQWQNSKPAGLTDAGIGALAVAVTCPWCRPKPVGRCTCGVACGHAQCVRLSRADLEYLDGRSEMPR